MRHFVRSLIPFAAALLAAAPALAAAPGGLPPMDSVPKPVNAGFQETVDEKPRLAILLKGTPREFGNQLTRALAGTRRFDVMDKAPQAIANAWPKLVPGIPMAQCRTLRNATHVDRVLLCDLHESGGELRVGTRLVWLDNGEVTRELALFGRSTAAKTLALQLATYVRRAMPLRCQVRSLADDHVVLDLGESSGMQKGSTFHVLRYTTNVTPVEIGTVRVTTLEPFSAKAEVEDAGKGLTVAPGDVAVEESSELALN